MPQKGISIIIPNWNGRHLLEKNLPFLIEALKFYPGETEIIVVDDGSKDGGSEFIAQSYPQVRTITSPVNEGFGATCNKGVMASRHEIVYLMNNDVRVRDNFLEPLLMHFDSDDIFAVTSVSFSPDDPASANFAYPTVRFRFGHFWYYYKMSDDSEGPVPTFFSSGGHSAYNKAKFIELGGFDELYHPFYWEDADICYRAWKRGWKSLYDPQSRVIHDHQSTIGTKFRKDFIQVIHWRNRFLFTWKNLHSPLLWAQHLFFLPFQLILMPLAGRGYFTKGFFVALKRLKKVAERRNIGVLDVLTDRKVLDIFKSNQTMNADD